MTIIQELRECAETGGMAGSHLLNTTADELDAKTAALTNLANAAAALVGKDVMCEQNETELAWLRAELENARKALGK